MIRLPLVSFMFCLVGLIASGATGPRAEDWREVESAQRQQLPRSAIMHLESIIPQALSERAYAEAAKGIALKVAIESAIEGNQSQEKIVRLQAELGKAPEALKPVLEALLAHWYWQYYQQNRWKFLQRTQTAVAPGPDLQTWDLARIIAEIDRHFSAALANDTLLKATRISDYDELFPAGNVPDAYRPTLFDFLTYTALEFYEAGENGPQISENEFEVDANSPVFADVTEFLKWTPPAESAGSLKWRAISLYQSLLRFHERDSDRSAYYDADLARLAYGKNVASGEAKDARFKAALERFIATTAQHEISAAARAALATQLEAEGDLLGAHRTAKSAVDTFPKSIGGALAFNLIQRITAPSVQLKTEQVWTAPWPTIDLTYRNVTRVYFRAMAVSFEEHLWRTGKSIAGLNEDDLARVVQANPAVTWSADLPTTSDFKERTEHLPAPTSLKPGFYYVAVSRTPEFGSANNQLSLTTVWVSDLALILRQRNDRTAQSGFVLHARSGEPVQGATVRMWERTEGNRLVVLEPLTTDANGMFKFTTQNKGVVVLAEHDGQSVSSVREFYSYGSNYREKPGTQTILFTDRAIYRPGQTINYKAVAISFDRAAGKYSAEPRSKEVVVFRDVNGQEIARATHTTNDYGSFSGVFTAPRDRALGAMSLQVLERSGHALVRVEEYKRPKFEVELSAPAEAPKLNAVVVLTGKATAYTGAAIGAAKVKWRVERNVQLPRWCWWWQPPATKAIAHGTAVTDANGNFKIEFPAEPDRTVPAKNEPVFVFGIHADVTDTAGETRSDDRSVRSGYTALQAAVVVDPWQTTDHPTDFTVSTTSLDSDPLAATGVLVVQALKQPTAVERSPLERERFWWSGPEEPKSDPANPDLWDVGEVVAQRTFATDAAGKTRVTLPLKAGIYRVSLETKDRFGQKVTARETVQVVDPDSARYSVKIPNLFVAPKWSVEPGDTFSAVWGTGYDTGRAFVEIECNGKMLKSYWTAATRTQERIKLPVTEAMRGGFTVKVTSVRENRAYFNEHIVSVPWTNKALSIKWERFRSKLLPGDKETWTAVVTGSDAKRTAAEMVATLYDASLDQILDHDWMHGFDVFRQERNLGHSEFQNVMRAFQQVRGSDPVVWQNVNWRYRAFAPELLFGGSSGVMLGSAGGAIGDDGLIVLSPFAVSSDALGYASTQSLAGSRVETNLRDVASGVSVVTQQSLKNLEVPRAEDVVMDSASDTPSKPDLGKVSARKNLNETAFFFPQLIAGDDGLVKMVFTMPEALTRWKFIGFAHDRQLRSGYITDEIVTAKDLMVEPNAPRFVREGDAIEFTVKVSNQSDQLQTGAVRLTFADAAAQNSVDEALGNRANERTFNVPAKESRSFSWRISVPDGMGFLTYKAVAATAKLSDGEEGYLPVLSRRVLVTESLPLPIRGKSTKEFSFKKLLDSGASDTLRHQSLTVQMTSQPAWYAVLALPYLMEFPHECSEQVFNRYYANALARHIANSDPKIRRVFDLWKNTAALDSPLEKNQELKSVMVEETPWLRAAKAESQARKNIGLLFDSNRLDEETARVLRLLSERQGSDGLWSWFPGGGSSEYISLYIVAGFGRLRHLGVKSDIAPAVKALRALDAWMGKSHREILKREKPSEYVPGSIDALYLYARSFFLQEMPIAKEQAAAVDFFLQQARTQWMKVGSRQSQAHLALALQRFGDKGVAQAIMKSLKERSVSSEELGMFWREQVSSWWWYDAPIETQAMMIEAFAEVGEDAAAVEACKVWLLKQKQTQSWTTTKATSDAIYALLLRGDGLLSSDAIVEVAVGGQTIKPAKTEAGTGFYEQRFAGSEIKPAMGRVTVKKTDDGVSWGSVHWQYLEDVAKITPHTGTPLTLKKTLWLKETTRKGQVLKPVTGPLAVGDELVVRLELRTDRDMEFVHLKDQRGSGTEPVNVLSQYRYQDGLGYYESTRDTASHYFIEYLRRGTYVFEYSTRVQLRGTYQSGIAEIQCMYAPEFNGHSESVQLEVR